MAADEGTALGQVGHGDGRVHVRRRRILRRQAGVPRQVVLPQPGQVAADDQVRIQVDDAAHVVGQQPRNQDPIVTDDIDVARDGRAGQGRVVNLDPLDREAARGPRAEQPLFVVRRDAAVEDDHSQRHIRRKVVERRTHGSRQRHGKAIVGGEHDRRVAIYQVIAGRWVGCRHDLLSEERVLRDSDGCVPRACNRSDGIAFSSMKRGTWCTAWTPRRQRQRTQQIVAGICLLADRS